MSRRNTTSTTNTNSIFNHSDVRDVRRILNRRHNQTIQIRKERKDGILRKRRFGDNGSMNTTSTRSATTSTNSLDSSTSILVRLQKAVETYCSIPSNNDNYDALYQIRDLFNTIKDDTIKIFLDELLQTSTSNHMAHIFVSQLVNNLRTSSTKTINTVDVTLAVLSILLQITSTSSSSSLPSSRIISSSGTAFINPNSTNNQQQSHNNNNDTELDEIDNDDDDDYNNYYGNGNDNYYGYTNKKWTDILLEEQPSSGNRLLPILLEILSNNNNKYSYSSVTNNVIKTSCHILGNLLQDDTSISSSSLLGMLIPQYWSLFVSNLPYSSYCCAAILRIDNKHYGMDYCSSDRLTPNHIYQLLNNPETEIDAVWILDGLCRREDNVVQYICQDLTIISLLIHKFHSHTATLVSSQGISTTTTTGTDSVGDGHSYEFIIPLLRSLVNICTACNGQYVSVFLSDATFVGTIKKLLDLPLRIKNNKRIIILFVETAYVAGCLLTDAGSSNEHPSTTIAVPNLLPYLINNLIASDSTFENKLASCNAIAKAIREPPPSEIDDSGTNNTTQGYPFSITSHETKSILRGIATNYIWGVDTERNRKLIQSLVDLLRSQDTDGVLSSLQIIDQLVRSLVVESSNLSLSSSTTLIRNIFEECDGVDALEYIGDVFPSTSPEASLAADLIDEFFDTDEDDYANANSSMDYTTAMPVVENNQFVFGLQAPAGVSPLFQFQQGQPVQQQPQRPPPRTSTDRPLAAALLLSTMPLGSQGRGKPLPAWMTQTNNNSKRP